MNAKNQVERLCSLSEPLQEISGYIDYTQRLQVICLGCPYAQFDDLEPFFTGARLLTPKNTDLRCVLCASSLAQLIL